MLIKVKNNFVAPLPILARLAIRYVYAKKQMKAEHIDLMMKSIVHWSKKIGITSDEQRSLEAIAKLLQKDKEGKLEERKELFARHKINWAKFHRVPEMKELAQ